MRRRVAQRAASARDVGDRVAQLAGLRRRVRAALRGREPVDEHRRQLVQRRAAPGAEVVGAWRAGPGAASVPATMSSTWTKSRCCSPSPKIAGASPRSSRVTKIVMTPTYGV